MATELIAAAGASPTVATARRTSDREPAVVADSLTKRFGEFVAVDDLTLTVPRGDIFGFLGPNGAGKTTTIRMLLGLVRPSAGRATVLGFDAEREAAAIRSRVGYVSQKFSLYRDLSARENLSFYGRVYGLEGSRLREGVAYGLAFTGLEGAPDRLARTLSGGYLKRLALACAVLHEPEAVFLDEPTAGVDPISRRRFWDYLYGLADDGRTVFVTTHYMDEADNCRHLALIDEGRIILAGTPTEMVETVGDQVLELECDEAEVALAALRAAEAAGGWPAGEIALYGAAIHVVAPAVGERMEALRRLLSDAGVKVRSMEVIPPSLEDAFLASVRTGRSASRARGTAGPFMEGGDTA